ncbi:unnamed protein product [Cylicocyclus nassatus]|uniref:Pre-mRNA-splicing factor SYF2 n=1 Tax=Cylicocyclus nassatus TaxID=53992 RepID=A0AA36MC41_CYLNA|nr:unnamed protein product [Cylicocyclus nassatus]
MRQVVGEDQFFSTQILLIMVCIIQHCKQWRSSLTMCRDNAPIHYINDKNKRFNKKLEKFHGQYRKTSDKVDLERGTAI